jgi:hypothetical protein
MATVASGVWELRVTQRTPAPEIEPARKRLKELLDA